MLSTKGRRGKLLLVIYILLLALTVLVLWRFGAVKEPETRKIGFVMPFSSASGQGASIYKGISAACEATGVELLLRDNVAESGGACPAAVDELVEAGANMIILSSAAYSPEMEPLFSGYPGVDFYGIFASTLSYEVANLTSYSTRMYQARYLSGIVAGMYSRSGKIGFVASERSSEVCRNLNAFALGVRRVNPDAEVVVSWSMGEQAAARDARALIEHEKVDVITYHQAQNTVVNVAEQAGIASIGYYEQQEGVSARCLTCVVCDWSLLYEQLIREYLQGMNTGNVLNTWLGLESDAVGLTPLSELVSHETRAEVENARQELLSGRDVFINEIYDNRGVLRCGRGESMTDDTLLRRMDWLVEGVRVYE